MASFLAFMYACFATFSKIVIPIIITNRMSSVVSALGRCFSCWLGLVRSREMLIFSWSHCWSVICIWRLGNVLSPVLFVLIVTAEQFSDFARHWEVNLGVGSQCPYFGAP